MTVHRRSGSVWDVAPELTLRGRTPGSEARWQAVVSQVALEVRALADELSPNDVRLLKAIASTDSIYAAARLLDPDRGELHRYLRKRIAGIRIRLRDFIERKAAGGLLLAAWERSAKGLRARRSTPQAVQTASRSP